MGLAKGGLIESRTEIEKASPKGTKAAITALMSTFPYPNDVWADAKTPTSPNRPWRILTATDNFRILMQRGRAGKKVPTPKSMKTRNSARRREAVQFEFGAKNYKFLFSLLGHAGSVCYPLRPLPPIVLV